MSHVSHTDSRGPAAPRDKRAASPPATLPPTKKGAAAGQHATVDLFGVLRQGAARLAAAPPPKAGSTVKGKGRTGGLSGGGGGNAGAGMGTVAARQRLLSMGFPPEQVDRALREAAGCEQRAVELCLGSS